MNAIQRVGTNARMSQAVIHGNTAYLAGAVADDYSGDIRQQTAEALAHISALLERIGTDASRLLTAQIWLRDIGTDFDAMNEVWEAWLPAGAAPTRASCEARMAAPGILVEIVITAAI